MNIAMISYHTCPRASAEFKENGGMEVYVLELSRALAKMGHEVDIFTRSHEFNDPLVIQEAPNLRVVHIPAGPQEKVQKKKLVAYIPEFAEHLLRFIHDEGFRYDVVHAHYYMSGLVAKKVFAAEKKFSVKPADFVMSFHTLALMKNLVARDTLERESQFRINAEFELMKRADAIIAASETDKAYMEYLYGTTGGNIHVIYPGINTDVFHPIEKVVAREHIGASREHKIVLFVGRVEPLKGIDTLMYAIKIHKSKHPRETVCLWIVGGDMSSKAMRELESLRSTLGIVKESVHFVGRQPQTELPYYYNAADVVVMPSHYESFGMTALEAMGCGVPVITTNVAGVSAHVSHVISVNNPLLLSDTIEHVLSEVHEKRAMNEFTWDVTAKKMLTVYSSRILKEGL